ncbi:unnamed protein product [Rodentolepis nana]|uniref:G_PROTEIN_RECEP_F1_2 domain-containing protein n=1 Tax=Rodentolepis nana TaxID=102285 RepID=A0A0R3TUR0_RODNA|nr:unnamed protein product [Rodentolepis nana]
MFPQGAVTTCTLFNVDRELSQAALFSMSSSMLIIDIAELVQTVTGVKCLLYADDLVLWYFAYFMQMIWYYGIPGLLYADDLVLWYSAYFTQMIWYYGIPPPRKNAKERTKSALNSALKLLANLCDNNGMVINTAKKSLLIVHLNY